MQTHSHVDFETLLLLCLLHFLLVVGNLCAKGPRQGHTDLQPLSCARISCVIVSM